MQQVFEIRFKLAFRQLARFLHNPVNQLGSGFAH